MEKDLSREARDWLMGNTVLAKVGGNEEPAIASFDLYQWLGDRPSNYARWVKDAVQRQQLVEGKDFVCSSKLTSKRKGRGGSNRKDYLLTANAAKRIVASDSSPKGRAILKALIDLADRVAAGDPELAADIAARVQSPEAAENVGDAAFTRSADLYRKQGKTEDWIQARHHGKVTRRHFTDALKAHGVTGPGYPRITDGMNKIIQGAPARELKKQQGTPASKSAREGMTTLQLAAQRFAEELAVDTIKKAGVKGNQACQRVAEKCAKRVRMAMDEE